VIGLLEVAIGRWPSDCRSSTTAASGCIMPDLARGMRAVYGKRVRRCNHCEVTRLPHEVPVRRAAPSAGAIGTVAR
jgi:hypothetical protein